MTSSTSYINKPVVKLPIHLCSAEEYCQTNCGDNSSRVITCISIGQRYINTLTVTDEFSHKTIIV